MIDMSSRDLHRYYVDSYLGIKENGKVKPVWVETVEGSELYSSGSTWDYRSEAIQYEYPDLGMVHVGKRCWWAYRLPERQWRKGLVPNLVMLKELGGPEQRLSDIASGTRAGIIKALYNPGEGKAARFAAKIKGEYWYRGYCIPDVNALVGTGLEYVYSYIMEQELQDIC